MLETSTTEIIILSILGLFIVSRIIASFKSEEIKSDKTNQIGSPSAIKPAQKAPVKPARASKPFAVDFRLIKNSGKEEEEEEPVYTDAALEAIEDETIRSRVFKMIEDYPGFSPIGFVNGAKSALEYVFNSFAELNKEKLEPLLSKNIYSLFEKEIDAKEGKDSYEVNLLVGIKDAVITGIAKRGDKVKMTVKFVTEQIKSLYKADEKNYQKASNILQINEEWEFEKDMQSNDPTWVVVST